jgi:proteic killer suppression protein
LPEPADTGLTAARRDRSAVAGRPLEIFKEQHSRKFGAIQRVAFRKLVTLHAAEALSDLAGVGNSLEALGGDRKGRHAIRVNLQYRLCFVWLDGKTRAMLRLSIITEEEIYCAKNP